MDVVLNWLWQGLVVAMACAAALRVLEPAPARVRCALVWAALLLVLVLPLVPTLALPGAPIGNAVVPSVSPVVSVPAVWWASSTLWLALWGAWSSLFLVRVLLEARAARRITRTLQPYPAAAYERLCRLTAGRGPGRPVRLGLSDRVQSAAVIGSRPPVIAVAPPLLDELTTDELDRVVLHEWAHVERRDDLAVIVQLLVRLVAGWHPAVRWLDHRLHLERELACDETVVALTGSSRAYAACLAKLASRPVSAAVVIPALGAVSSGSLSYRITRILRRVGVDQTRPLRGLALISALVLSALTLAAGGVRLAVSVVPARAIGLDARVIPAGLRQSFMLPALAVEFPRTEAPAATPSAPTEPPIVASSSSGASDEGVGRSGLEPETLSAAIVSSALAPGWFTWTPGVPRAQVEPYTVGDAEPAPGGVAGAVLPGSSVPESPWAATAEAGMALARSSRDAGTATAGFFTRVGRRIAASF